MRPSLIGVPTLASALLLSSLVLGGGGLVRADARQSGENPTVVAQISPPRVSLPS
ncbi:MAG: hypothetical protein LVS60_01440 [Nodosilinea sp. LVE1205-7]